MQKVHLYPETEFVIQNSKKDNYLRLMEDSQVQIILIIIHDMKIIKTF